LKRKLSVFAVLILLTATIYISYILYSEVEEKTIQYQYQQQEMYAAQTVLSIQNFFETFEHSLQFLSTKEEIINFNAKSKTILKDYFNSHKNELKAITRISAQGKILYTFPIVDEVIGSDVSSQPHNAEIIKTHHPTISDVFTTLQGYRAIVFAYPVFENTTYNGCISLVIPFDFIAHKFLENIKFGKNGSAFLISEDGIELFCSIKEHVGISIHENMKGFSNTDDLITNMLNKKEGRTEYNYFRSERDKKIVKKIAVYKPIILENTFWSLAVLIPEIEVLEANRGFIFKLISFLGLMFLILLLLGYFYLRQKIKTRDLIDEKEKKYKSDLEYLVKVRTDELNKLNENLRIDIIKRKKVEKKLKETVIKAEKSEKIKSDFLAQISHEIRTPINTILSFSSLINEELAHYANEELKYSFSGIQSAGKRLIRTIDLILNMADVQAGTHDYIPKEIDLCNDIINNLATEYKVQIKEKNLKLEIVEKSVATKIIADSYSVNQIFANLIDNAIKYTSEGTIKIVCDRNENNETIVSVIDTGLGISQNYIPKLFDEFSQEDVGYTRRYDGNGLGLALVKKYCELNNAEITVRSEKGKGSRFTVKFSNNKKALFHS
jgi:signal transduction histidine kinase